MNGKMRPLKKRAIVRTLEIEAVSFPPPSPPPLPSPYGAFFGGMRPTRVDRDGAHNPCVVLAGGRGSGVATLPRARVSVALRVRSYSCPRHIDCNHFYQTCV